MFNCHELFKTYVMVVYHLSQHKLGEREIRHLRSLTVWRPFQAAHLLMNEHNVSTPVFQFIEIKLGKFER